MISKIFKLKPRLALKALKYFLGQFKNLSRWISHNPVQDSFILDFRDVPASSLRHRFLGVLWTIATDPELKDRRNHLYLILNPEGFGHIPDLFMLFSFLHLPGNLEFFETVEDCRQHHFDLTQGLFSVSMFPEDKRPKNSVSRFRGSTNLFVPPMNYLAQARSFFKSFGKERSIYICDLTHLTESNRLPESWNHFLAAFASSAKDSLILVLTPPDVVDDKYVHSNIIFIKELGMTLHDLMAFVWMVDGFIGTFDLLAPFALQRNIPILLVSDNLQGAGQEDRILILKENASGAELWSAFLGIRNQNKKPLLFNSDVNLSPLI